MPELPLNGEPFPNGGPDENQFELDKGGNESLGTIINGDKGGPGGGPGPLPKSEKGKKIPWKKIGHFTKEAAIYGSGAGLVRGKYRDRKEEDVLVKSRAAEMGKDILGGITTDTSDISYYDLIGVKPTATQDQIAKAYRSKSKVLHPDVNPSQEAADAMKLLNEAYNVLKDPKQRAAYDAKRAKQTTGPSFEDLPGSYKRKFRKQARGQVRTEKEVISEARKLGIPLNEPVMKTWDQMTTEEQEKVKQTLGGQIPKKGTRMAVGVGSKRKPIAQLAKEVEGHKGTLATTRIATATAEDILSEMRPSAVKKTGRGISKAVAGTGQVLGGTSRVIANVQSRTGTTPLGKRLTTSSSSGSRLIRGSAAASESDKSMGLGHESLRSAVGSSPRLKIRDSQGPLKREGGPATRRRSAFSSRGYGRHRLN